MVHPYSLLGNFSITCGSVVPPKSPSLSMSMAGSFPTCPSTAFDPPRRGEEPAGQHLVLCRFSGQYLTSGSPRAHSWGRPWGTWPMSHFPRSKRPEIVTATSYGMETCSRLQQRVNKTPRNGGIWGIFSQFGAVLQNYLLAIFVCEMFLLQTLT